MKKKILALSLLTASLIATSGCGKTAPAQIETQTKTESTSYIMTGRYYFTADLKGQVLTSDGNLWDYTQDIISEEPAYNNEPVFVVFNDNGTPENIYDDPILGVVLDRETAIYDALEVELSKSFTVERDENNIRIGRLNIAD